MILVKISRYLLIIVAIVILANILPNIYNTIFDVRIDSPYVTYSTQQEDFFVQKQGSNDTFVDTEGREYSQDEFLEATPIVNAVYHAANGTLPDSLNGKRLHVQRLRQENFRDRISPTDFSEPTYELYPLFESEPEYGLTFPKDFFRFSGKRIEFIDAESNEISEEKSRKFTEALEEENFAFPPDLVAGMPTLLKDRDDGWFLIDNKSELYHLKMIKGEPYVKYVSTPDDFEVKEIFPNDFSNREFLALIVTEDNRLFILDYNDYSLTEFPIYDYKPSEEQFSINGNMFHRIITLTGDDYVKSYALNRDYEKVDEYYDEWKGKSEMIEGKVAGYLFPFNINFESSNTRYIKFMFDGFRDFNWIYLNLVLLGGAYTIIQMKKRKISRNILDLMLVAGTGIYGFIATLLFPNKEY